MSTPEAAAVGKSAVSKKSNQRKFGLFCCRGGPKGYSGVREPKTHWGSQSGPEVPAPGLPKAVLNKNGALSKAKRNDDYVDVDELNNKVTKESSNPEGVVAQVQKDPRFSFLPQLPPEDIQELMRLRDNFRYPLLGPQRLQDRGRKTLILDLDETLVHSSFQPVPMAAFVIPVEIESLVYEIYVAKRPGVEEFLDFCAELYEVVIFTASLGNYADPLLDKIDPKGKCPWRLFRESCVLWQGNYIKDLSKLGRNLKDVLIVDNSPASSLLQPDNAIPIRSWFDDPDDRELYELMPILRALSRVEDIQAVIRRTATFDSDEEEMETRRGAF